MSSGSHALLLAALRALPEADRARLADEQGESLGEIAERWAAECEVMTAEEARRFVREMLV